jgi:hypothetical protein
MAKMTRKNVLKVLLLRNVAGTYTQDEKLADVQLELLHYWD